MTWTDPLLRWRTSWPEGKEFRCVGAAGTHCPTQARVDPEVGLCASCKTKAHLSLHLYGQGTRSRPGPYKRRELQRPTEWAVNESKDARYEDARSLSTQST